MRKVGRMTIDEHEEKDSADEFQASNPKIPEEEKINA